MSQNRKLSNLFLGSLIFLFSQLAFAGISLDTVIGKYCKSDCVSAEVLAKAVLKNSASWKLNPRHLLTVIKTESRFKISAKNGSSHGLMQVHLLWHRQDFKTSYLDPEENIRVGAKIFADCHRRFHKLIIPTLKCYNGGGDPNYSAKFMKNLEEMKGVIIPGEHEEPQRELAVSDQDQSSPSSPNVVLAVIPAKIVCTSGCVHRKPKMVMAHAKKKPVIKLSSVRSKTRKS